MNLLTFPFDSILSFSVIDFRYPWYLVFVRRSTRNPTEGGEGETDHNSGKDMSITVVDMDIQPEDSWTRERHKFIKIELRL